VLFFHYRDLFPGVCRKFSQIHIFLFLKSHYVVKQKLYHKSITSYTIDP